MFTVYVLFSEKFRKIYIGFTSAFEIRLLSHNILGTKGFTKRYRPWAVLHTELFIDKKELSGKLIYFSSSHSVAIITKSSDIDAHAGSCYINRKRRIQLHLPAQMVGKVWQFTLVNRTRKKW
jgi:putative endonuclease